MDFENLKYDIQKNKGKIMLAGAAIFFIVVAVIAFKMFGVKFNYGSNSGNVVSEKYVLADYILGGNNNGTVNMYDTKTGESLSDSKLGDGDFIYSKSSDMKQLNALNTTTNELYKVYPKGKKIKVDKVGILDIGKNKISSFKYEGNYFVGLLSDNKKFITIDIKNSKSINVDLKLNASINNFEVTKNNIVFTSGDYICTAKLSDGKGKKINIGDISSSIHLTKNKLFVHNSFGADRNKSILLDINPETLYINKAYQFKESLVNMMQTSSDSEILYYSEQFLSSSEGNVKQIIKTIGEEMKNPSAIMKHTGKGSINKSNSYGYLGYSYYKNEDLLEVYNLRNLEKEYTLKIQDDFYMPVY